MGKTEIKITGLLFLLIVIGTGCQSTEKVTSQSEDPFSKHSIEEKIIQLKKDLLTYQKDYFPGDLSWNPMRDSSLILEAAQIEIEIKKNEYYLDIIKTKSSNWNKHQKRRFYQIVSPLMVMNRFKKELNSEPWQDCSKNGINVLKSI